MRDSGREEKVLGENETDKIGRRRIDRLIKIRYT